MKYIAIIYGNKDLWESFPADETLPTGCGTLLKTVGSGFKQIEPYKCYYDINVSSGAHLNPLTGKTEAK